MVLTAYSNICYINLQEAGFFTKFLSYMVTLMTEDQIRFFSAKLPSESVVPPSLPPDMYATWISQHPLAAMVAMYYTLQVTLTAVSGLI